MTTGFNGHHWQNGVLDQYLQLLAAFPPRLIRSEEEYWAMQTVMDKLIDKGDLSKAEQDYLSLLGMRPSFSKSPISSASRQTS